MAFHLLPLFPEKSNERSKVIVQPPPLLDVTILLMMGADTVQLCALILLV
jgi:hypothetical protein